MEHTTASMFSPDEFKQRVADEMGLNSTKPFTLTCLGDTGYRIDLSVGKHHSVVAVPVLGVEQVRYASDCFKACIRKWSKQDEEQQKRDMAMKPITLIEARPGHLSVQNRRMDTDNALDEAIFEFVFKYNLKASGLPTDEIEALWKDSPWGKESHLSVY